jgi:hypothetical protein
MPRQQLTFQFVTTIDASGPADHTMATTPTVHYCLQRGAFEPHQVNTEVSRDDRVPKTDFCFLDTDFPQELQDMVWDHLTPRELTSVRITCRKMAKSVRMPWITGTFGEVSIYFTDEHIRNLDGALTASGDHAAAVKTLRIYSHIRSNNLSPPGALLLRRSLAAVIAKMPNLSVVVVVGDDFANTDVFVVPDHELSRNGLNCHLRHVLLTLRKNPNKVTKFCLERVTARHRLDQETFEGDVMPDLEDISIIECGQLTLEEEGPGCYGVPAMFIDQFKTVTSLSFGSHGHTIRGCEMARLLNDVRLPALKNIHLSNAVFFENDVLKFCFEHQKTLQLIEFKEVTLRAFRFDSLIKDIIKYDQNWADGEGSLDMKVLKTIRVSRACESWHFDCDDHGEGDEDVHRSIMFWGMDDDCDGCWEDEVFEVHGRGNPGHNEEYAKFLAFDFERVVLDNDEGCEEAYHKCENLTSGFYEDFEGDDAQTMQKFKKGKGETEYSGEPHEEEVSWWTRHVPLFDDGEGEE